MSHTCSNCQNGAVHFATCEELQKSSKTQEYVREHQFLELLGAILAHFNYLVLFLLISNISPSKIDVVDQI